MKKLFVFLLTVISLFLILAADPKPKVAINLKPEVEAVPAPAVDPDDVPSTKVSKGTQEAIEETKIGLIKAEKVYVDKNCHMVKGTLKCNPKEVKRKTIDSDEDLKDVDQDNTP